MKYFILKYRNYDLSFLSGQAAGNPDLFRYAQSSVFNAKYLGHIRDLRQEAADNQTKTLAAIHTAQVQIAFTEI